MTEVEVWLPVVGYEGLYEVSNLGRVRSNKSGSWKLLKGSRGMCAMGYWRVTLSGCEKKARYVHQLVLEAFVSPRPMGMIALHRDGDQFNNNVLNLYWGTPKQNMQDRVDHGRGSAGSQNPRARLTMDDIQKIRKSANAGRIRQVDLARQFSVSQAHISRIVRHESWGNSVSPKEYANG